ncbi:hypothetical protein AAG906_040636 [Vitis piasezkii]
MGWLPVVTISEPVFPNFVRAFYSRVTYGMGGPIISTVRGVKICLDQESICHIFDITPVGLRGMGKPSVHSLIVISRVLHHMICSIILPRGGHRDEISYYETFLIDPILTGKQIHLGYLMMMHMISCCESTTCVLPYSRFLTRVFKDVDIDLIKETDFEAPNAYDTYDDQSMGRMKFEKAPDEPELDIPSIQSEGVQFEATFSEPMMSKPTYIVGPSTQSSFTESSSEPAFTEPPYIEIPPHQAPLAPNHALWIDLST